MIDSPLFRFLAVEKQDNPAFILKEPVTTTDDAGASFEILKGHLLSLDQRVERYNETILESQRIAQEEIKASMQDVQAQIQNVSASLSSLAPCINQTSASLLDLSRANNENFTRHVPDLSQTFAQSHSLLCESLLDDRRRMRELLDVGMQEIRAQNKEVQHFYEKIVAIRQAEDNDSISQRLHNVEKACLQLSADVRSLTTNLEASSCQSSTQNSLQSSGRLRGNIIRSRSPSTMPTAVGTRKRQLEAEMSGQEQQTKDVDLGASGKCGSKKRKIAQSEWKDTID
ncbi:hypothetical protein BT69DRAFT_346798 [Atractiella rhizophila]|nr:hypothetical protein BT69DRAFT_346798 [Atractiella rhizophila]